MKVIFVFTFISFCFLPNQNIYSAEKKTTSKKYKRTNRKVIKKRKAPKQNKAIVFIDETQRFISDFWLNVNYGMDSFFAGKKYSKKENKARILAYYDVFKREGDELKNYFDISIKIDLPKLSKRLSVTIEKERDDILESRSNQVTQGQATKESDYAASVNYVNRSNFISTQLNTGFRFDMPLDPFIKYRLFKNFDVSWFKIHLEQMFTYYRQEYLSEYTQMSFSKKINDYFSLSQSNVLSWTDADDTFVLRNAIILSQIINEKQSLSYVVGANALLDPTYYYNKYDASISYRRILYKKWLFGSVGYGADFSKEDNWSPKSFGLIRLEILFQQI